jgi:hypothetical protein
MMSDSPISNSESNFRPLSEGERSLLTKLLSAEFPGKEALLEQMVDVKARRIDALGGLALAPVENAAVANVVRRIPVEAELDDRDGVTVHVLLHVLNGLMNELEVYRDDSGPIQRLLSSDDFRLIVLA